MCATDTDKLQIYKACENVRCLKSMVIHYITHQQLVCRKYLNLSYHWTSRINGELHYSGNKQSDPWIFPRNRSWISWLALPNAHFDGLALAKFYCDLLYPGPRYNLFLNEKNYSQLLLPNNEWLRKLAFSEGFIMFPNQFNLKLQGKTVLIGKIFTAVKSFQQ